MVAPPPPPPAPPSPPPHVHIAHAEELVLLTRRIPKHLLAVEEVAVAWVAVRVERVDIGATRWVAIVYTRLQLLPTLSDALNRPEARSNDFDLQRPHFFEITHFFVEMGNLTARREANLRGI